MVLVRILWAGIIAFFAMAIASFFSIQGTAIVGSALFSPLGAMLLMAAVFGELTATAI